MRLTIKAKQVLGVTSIVGLAVVGLGGLYVSGVARVRLEASQAAGELLANAIYHRAREAAASSRDPYAALRGDPGLRSILESSAYSPNVTYAAIVDPSNVAVAHSDGDLVGKALPVRPSLDTLLAEGAWIQLRAIYADEGPTLEIQRPLLMGERRFGTIRIGVSMLLTRADLDSAIRPAVVTAVLAVLGASLVAMLLAQSLLRPIHLIRAGLSRLGRGEFGVTVDVPGQDELGDLGGFFNALSAQLSAERTKLIGQQSTLESVVARLEDAVAFFTPAGELLFANPAMQALMPAGCASGALQEIWPAYQPYRQLVEQTSADGQARGPVSVRDGDSGGPVGATAPGADGPGDRLVLTHPIRHAEGRLIGVMLVARDLGYLGAVHSTLQYSRKLAALSRLSAGVAHEIKNPLNAISIHLELLKQQLPGPPGMPDGEPETPPIDRKAANEHVAIIGAALRRLDEVLQSYLKFTRPEDLKLQPVLLSFVLNDLLPIVQAEAQRSRVEVRVECPPSLPAVLGDPGMLQQAFLNLALNACQAMPDGGRLRIAGRAVKGRQVEIIVEDTGAGIAPEHLDKVFNLYFTTRATGTGMGLSLVYRTIQLHDGEIEVDSSPGTGTVFRILLPQA